MNEETKRKISQNNGMHNPEVREKVRKYRIGKHFWTNGIITVCSEECPEGFIKGMVKRKK